jgi:hypothetical protein
MEAIFLVCGAGGPQLKRNPLGGGTLTSSTQTPSAQPPELPPSLARVRTIRIVYAVIVAVVGGVSLAGSHYVAGSLLLTLAGWRLFSALRLPADYRAEIVENERSQVRAIASGPVSQCPRCGWLSYNGNTTRCIQCNSLLTKLPAIGTS